MSLHNCPPAIVAACLSKRSLLLGFCLRWTRGNLSEAEDLLGDACVRIMEGGYSAGVRVARPIALWATVINNLGRDRARHRRRWRFDVRGPDMDSLNDLPAHTVSAEHQVIVNERLEATARKLQSLNQRQRTAMLLRGGGLGYSRIGESLCTSPANARKLVETGRRFLNSGDRSKASRKPAACFRSATRPSSIES
ncbi:MAG TPA: sigma-70 family RNA polymerase sigma factor [Polyangiaceae bacterium]|nr:sigma-70 family RNA polymerase sigma factor [Polyangiaceae bacterium]